MPSQFSKQSVTCTVAVGQCVGWQRQSPEEPPAWWTEGEWRSCLCLPTSVAGSLVERVWRPLFQMRAFQMLQDAYKILIKKSILMFQDGMHAFRRTINFAWPINTRWFILTSNQSSTGTLLWDNQEEEEVGIQYQLASQPISVSRRMSSIIK